MPNGELKILVRSRFGDPVGADVETIIKKLSALKYLHDASVAAEVNPGRRKSALPKAVRQLTSLIVTHASAGASLQIAVRAPSTPPASYEGPFASVPDASTQRFKGSLVAASAGDDSAIQLLFKERADRARALDAITRLSDGHAGFGVMIHGVGRTPLVLDEDTAVWARERMPTTAPEDRTFVGIVNRGQLGAESRFTITDGKIAVPIRPHHGMASVLKKYFGEIVESKRHTYVWASHGDKVYGEH